MRLTIVVAPGVKRRTRRSLSTKIVATSVLDRVRVRLLGLPLQLGAYADILEALGIGGYRDEELGLAGAVDYGDAHFTCFQFPYDWRRSVAENAQRLGFRDVGIESGENRVFPVPLLQAQHFQKG